MLSENSKSYSATRTSAFQSKMTYSCETSHEQKYSKVTEKSTIQKTRPKDFVSGTNPHRLLRENQKETMVWLSAHQEFLSAQELRCFLGQLQNNSFP